jgi:hypothetical protein
MAVKYTELRIHGVAGPPPEYAPPHPVDAVTPDAGETDRRAGIAWRQEAYVWGDLTSGSRSRAFWLLLLPFALANIAFHMSPRCASGADRREPGRALRRTVEMGHRLFALSLTGTLITAVAGASMDIVGWQSPRHGPPGFPPLHWLATAATQDPGRRIGLASLAPALLLALIWWLARVTWNRYDRCGMKKDKSDEATVGVLIAQRRMWNGADPVGRLRSLHVAFGFALISLALMAPFQQIPTFRATWLAAAILIAVVVALIVVPKVGTRHGPGAEPGWSLFFTVCCSVLRLGALILYGAALAITVTRGMRPDSDAGAELTGFHPLLAALFWTQVALLAGITVGTAALVALRARTRRRTAADPEVAYGTALLGLGAPVMLVLAWTLATVFSVGLAFTVAEIFGTPSFRGGPAGILLPVSYWWSSLAGPGSLLAALLVGGVLWFRWRRLSRDIMRRGTTRDKRVSDFWAAARLTDSAAADLATIAFVATMAIVAGGTLLALRPESTPGGPLIVAGIVMAVGYVVTLIVVGWWAYGNPALRRTVGVLWDISTFWPRAAHPLAPPCYTERVIPELLQRVEELTENGTDRVVISGHSQGSVIGAVLVLQLDPATRGRTHLLTHGSPLCRLYTRFFPAYFAPRTFGTMRELLIDTDPRAPLGWHNLYRPSDPIGGPVFRIPATGEVPRGHDVDEFVPDPAEPARPGGAPPQIYGHADYHLSPAYDIVIRKWVDWGNVEDVPTR